MYFKSVLLVVLGFAFLLLGAIGLVLPIWPTTPFVLVSAACFSGSPRLRKRIMSIGFFKEHFENYARRTGLTPKTTAISLAYLWATLLLSMFLNQKPWIILLLAAVGIAVTIHITCMAKTKKTAGSAKK